MLPTIEGLPQASSLSQSSRPNTLIERMLRMETCFDADTGFVQVYTGDGKGKTTAALVALCAAGAG